MKKYKLVVSENQDNFVSDTLKYCKCGHYYFYAAARPKAEEQQAITLLGREETACPTQ